MRSLPTKRFALALLAASATGAGADAILDSSLERVLDLTASGNWIPVFVELGDQFDTRSFEEQLRSAGADADARHREIMLALQAHSATQQAPYLDALRALEAEGELARINPLWISNGIELDATSRGVAELVTLFDDAVLFHDYVELIEPTDRGVPMDEADGHEWGLDQIGAPMLWEMGIFGQGSIVANLDTGVDGAHKALDPKWLGHEEDVEWWHAWYAEDASQFPSDNDSHGTHTMGTMVGSVVGDTIGVAPAAKWIAARVGLSGNPGVNINSAFQWCADPDTNPQTTDDVPDAVNNSWGGGFSCSSYHWTPIDNMEAMGAIAFFSAGNEGPGSQTIGSPGNRATTHANCFAVGATNESEAIAGFSSRGPTRCVVPDSLKFKPEASAPGVAVRSSIPNNGYAAFNGTSMACPHVAGAAALLRQIMPELPPQQLKTLLYRTARHPTNPGTEDNIFGRGIIDLDAAANYLFNEFDLDGHISGAVTEHGTGQPLPEATVEVLEAHIIKHPEGNGSYDFHVLAREFTVVTSLFGYYPDTTMVTVPGGGVFTHDVSLRELPLGSIAGTLSNNGGAGISADLTIYHESNDSLIATLSTGGDGSFTQDIKIGSYRVVVHPAPPEMFYTVESVVVDSALATDLTTEVEVADVLLVDADGGETNYESYFVESIEGASRSFNMWDKAAAGIADVAVASMPTTSKVIWMSGDATENIMSAEEETALVVMLIDGGRLYLSGQNIVESIDGGSLLNHLNLGYGGTTNEHVIYAVEGNSMGDAIDKPIFTTGSEPPLNQRSQDLLVGGSPAGLYNGVEGDVALLTRLTGKSRTVVSGYGLEGVHGELPGVMTRTEFLQLVLDYLDDLVGIEGEGLPPALPKALSLAQNTPNPFNPSTLIHFSLPEAGSVKLGVYDARGNLVATLIDGRKEAGNHAARWDGQNLRGVPVASGVYFYRLDAGGSRLTRRMVLVK